MALHLAELAGVELAGLEQDGVGDPQLAHVVEEGPLQQRAHRRRVQPGRLSHAPRVDGDAVVVGVGVAVALGDGAAHHAQRLEVGVEQAARERLQPPQEARHDRVDEQRGGEHHPDPEGDGVEEADPGLGPLPVGDLEPRRQAPGDAPGGIVQGQHLREQPARVRRRPARRRGASHLGARGVADGDDRRSGRSGPGSGSSRAGRGSAGPRRGPESPASSWGARASCSMAAPCAARSDGELVGPPALAVDHHAGEEHRDHEDRDGHAPQQRPLDGTVALHHPLRGDCSPPRRSLPYHPGRGASRPGGGPR